MVLRRRFAVLLLMASCSAGARAPAAIPADAPPYLLALHARCANVPGVAQKTRAAPETGARRQQLLQRAICELGRPYRYGGEGQNGFDCSGFVQQVFDRVEVALPRTTAEQFRSGRRIPLANALPGDLVFFRIEGGMHVGIYVGDGHMVHAPRSGKRVMLSPLRTPYWKKHYAGTVRILGKPSSTS